jgi:hypothetical protein
MGTLSAAFIVGTGAGLLGVFSGHHEAGPEQVTFEVPPTSTPTPKPVVVTAAFTATATRSGHGILLFGTAPGARAGDRVTVQRKQSGHWTDFPASASVGSDRHYAVKVSTGTSGEQAFRVIDDRTGRVSQAVTVPG